jgi:hypothetical protein
MYEVLTSWVLFLTRMVICIFLWVWIMCLNGSRLSPQRLMITKWFVKFLQDHIFARFGTPRAMISDGGSQWPSGDKQPKDQRHPREDSEYR